MHPNRPAARWIALLLLAAFPHLAQALPDDGDRDLRYDADGFGRAVITGVDDVSDASVACGPDGTCYLASTSEIAGDDDFRLRRFTSSGTFLSQGSAAFQLGGLLGDHAHAVAVQPDGKVVVVGEAADGTADGFRFAVARFAPGPVGVPLDTTFSGDGKATVDFNGGVQAHGVAIAPDGKIVIAGCYETGAGRDIAVIRLDSTGALDPTFDGNGVATYAVNSGGTNNDCAYAVAVQRDGKIVVAGFFDVSATSIWAIVVRFTTAGAPDSSFSSEGSVHFEFDSTLGVLHYARAVAIDGRDRILVGGTIEDGGSGIFTAAMVRFTPTGNFDPFGTGEHWTGEVGAGGLRSVALGPPPSNRIYFLKAFSSPRVGALTAAGALDPTFSGDGLVPFDDPAGNAESALGMTLAGGMPVVAGDSSMGATDYQIVGRYFTHLVFGDDFESGNLNRWTGW